MAGSQRLRWKAIPLRCHRRAAAMRLVRPDKVKAELASVLRPLALTNARNGSIFYSRDTSRPPLSASKEAWDDSPQTQPN